MFLLTKVMYSIMTRSVVLVFHHMDGLILLFLNFFFCKKISLKLVNLECSTSYNHMKSYSYRSMNDLHIVKLLRYDNMDLDLSYK